MADLVRQIGEEVRTVQLRQATVVGAPAAGRVSIRFGTGGATVGGVRMLNGASPQANEAVFVLQQGYDMLVLGPVNNQATNWDGGPVFKSGVELYHPASNPFIDFHRAASQAGDSNADYDTRLISEVSGQLKLYGRLIATIGVHITGDWFRVEGNTGIHWQAWGGGWYMQDASWVRSYLDKGVHTGGKLGAHHGRMGCHSVHVDHVQFCHADRENQSNDYQFLARSDGWCWVHGPTITLSGAGATRVTIDGNATHMNQNFSLAQQQMRVYQWNDGNHIIRYLAASDTEGPFIQGWGGAALRGHANDATARLQWGDGNFVLFDNGSAWGMKSIASGGALKQAVRGIDRKAALVKLRQLKPVEFKRKYHDARPERRQQLAALKAKRRPAPLPEPDPLPPSDPDAVADTERVALVTAWSDAMDAYRQRQSEIEQYDWDLENAEVLLAHMEWRWETQLDPAVQRPEIGFIAEDMEEVEPLVVSAPTPVPPVMPPNYKGRQAPTPPPAHEQMGKGIMYGQVTALLAAALQEEDAVVQANVGKTAALEQRLAAAEARVKAAEDKAAQAEARLSALERGRPA